MLRASAMSRGNWFATRTLIIEAKAHFNSAFICSALCENGRKWLSHSSLAGVSSGNDLMHNAQYLRRKTAGEYLKTKFGFGSEKTLAKLACVGGGPEFCKAGTAVLYTQEALDMWALAKIGGPVRSTSARDPQSEAPSKSGRPAGVTPVSVARDRAEAFQAELEAV